MSDSPPPPPPQEPPPGSVPPPPPAGASGPQTPQGYGSSSGLGQSQTPGASSQGSYGDPGTGSAKGMTGDQVRSAVQGANRLDLALIGCGLLAFLLSFFPYYTASVKVSGASDLAGLADASNSASANAWHGFFGWFAALLALAVAVVAIMRLLGLGLEAGLAKMVVLGGSVAALVCVILALVVFPDGGSALEGTTTVGDVTLETSTGHGIGYWLSLLVILAMAVIAFLRYQANDAGRVR